MAALSSQSIVQAGTTPVPITPTASDTIPAAQFGANGCVLRCITTGTPANISVLDPSVTALNNPGTVSPVVLPATGNRMIRIPLSAINPATQVATVTSSSQTGLTYELYQV
jgi:hypothetical protein